MVDVSNQESGSEQQVCMEYEVELWCDGITLNNLDSVVKLIGQASTNGFQHTLWNAHAWLEQVTDVAVGPLCHTSIMTTALRTFGKLPTDTQTLVCRIAAKCLMFHQSPLSLAAFIVSDQSETTGSESVVPLRQHANTLLQKDLDGRVYEKSKSRLVSELFGKNIQNDDRSEQDSIESSRHLPLEDVRTHLQTFSTLPTDSPTRDRCIEQIAHHLAMSLTDASSTVTPKIIRTINAAGVMLSVPQRVLLETILCLSGRQRRPGPAEALTVLGGSLVELNTIQLLWMAEIKGHNMNVHTRDLTDTRNANEDGSVSISNTAITFILSKFLNEGKIDGLPALLALRWFQRASSSSPPPPPPPPSPPSPVLSTTRFLPPSMCLQIWIECARNKAKSATVQELRKHITEELAMMVRSDDAVLTGALHNEFRRHEPDHLMRLWVSCQDTGSAADSFLTTYVSLGDPRVRRALFRMIQTALSRSTDSVATKGNKKKQRHQEQCNQEQQLHQIARRLWSNGRFDAAIRIGMIDSLGYPSDKATAMEFMALFVSSTSGWLHAGAKMGQEQAWVSLSYCCSYSLAVVGNSWALYLFQEFPNGSTFAGRSHKRNQ